MNALGVFFVGCYKSFHMMKGSNQDLYQGLLFCTISSSSTSGENVASQYITPRTGCLFKMLQKNKKKKNLPRSYLKTCDNIKGAAGAKIK